MEPTVLVTGVGGPAGRAGAAYFAERGCRVVGTDMAAASSAAAHFRLVPAARDPAFPAALLELVERERASLAVITVTEELPVAARLKAELRRRGCAISISDPPGTDLAADKLLTARALARAGVAVPRSFDAGARDEAVRALGFPLLSKPRLGRGGRGVVVHRSPDDLDRAHGDVVWQEFLPGEEFDVNLFVEAAGGRAPAAVVLRKTGLKDGLVGNALGVERVLRPDLRDLAVRAALALRLEGPLDLDVRLASDGAPAVLEVNARLGANVLSAREVLDALDDAWRNGRCA